MKRLPTIALSVVLATAGVAAMPASAAFAASPSLVILSNGSSTITEVVPCTASTLALSGGTVKEVENHCAVRMWLHQFVNGSGYSQCISPRMNAAAIAGRTYRQVQVTTNPAAC